MMGIHTARRICWMVSSCFAAVALASPGTVSAQATEPAADVQNPDLGSDEIIVTARRRDESMQETPIAVTAFTPETLADRSIQTTQDLEAFTPSLQFKSAGQLSGNSAATVVFIRGVGQLDPTAAVDPGVGIYLDEVYLGRAVGGAIDFGDIAGVEILRGPQGTLFGRNTIGGAILVRTQQPVLGEFSGKVRGRVGSDNLHEAFGVVNVPLGDIVAARLSGGFKKRDGYVIRAFDGLDLGNDNSYSFGGSLKVEPSNDFDLFVRGDYNKRDEHGAPFVFAGINEQAPVPAIVSVGAGCPGATIPYAPLAPGNPRFGAPNVPLINDARCANDLQARGPFVNGGTAAVTSTSETWGLAATARAKLNDWLTFKSITSYRSTKSRGVRDADNTPFTILTTDLTTDSKQVSQEMQFQIDKGIVHAIVGTFFYNEKTFERATVYLAFPPSPPLIGSILAGGPGSRDLQLSKLETDSLAVFGEASVEAAPGLELTGGLRYTVDDKSYLGNVRNLFPGTLPDPDPIATKATSEGGPLFIFYRPNKRKFTALTGSASVRYAINDNVSTYVSYAKSFKSGGFNTRYNAPPPGNQPVPFDEEQVTSYEVGAKFSLGRARLNLAAYRANYDDIQLIFRQGVVPLLFNAGKARIQGLEAEFAYHPASGLQLDASASYLDDRIKSVTLIPGATATVAPGEDLPLTPTWQTSFGVGYKLPIGEWELTPRFDGSYQSYTRFITGSVPLIEQSGYFVGNASITFAQAKGGLRVQAGVQNVTDKRYKIQGNASLATLGYAEVIYARPRNWYLQIGYQF
ncbi:TonB-dependent receptor [Sphingobium sp. DEHP117]|uniref:TonB-dependent receptor n=1 Tax=Sphingobium sp. DEHP117 TaxID=2993436 RepID=UPI0027D568D2|nr:TonB-dependent receptor [Sphingobium sp. DEHP117]MDQ4419313.1 TonB-dependent receptor [Sphingobium sp. DEHP117]